MKRSGLKFELFAKQWCKIAVAKKVFVFCFTDFTDVSGRGLWIGKTKLDTENLLARKTIFHDTLPAEVYVWGSYSTFFNIQLYKKNTYP